MTHTRFEDELRDRLRRAAAHAKPPGEGPTSRFDLDVSTERTRPSRTTFWLASAAAGVVVLAVIGTAVLARDQPTGFTAGDDSTVDPAEDPECFPNEEVEAARQRRAKNHVPPVEGQPTTQPEPRFEDIVELLTEQRQLGEEEGSAEETIDDPNFGGVWGDRKGGVVVAVLDCALVDVNELTRLAGGPEYLRLLQVRYSFQQMNGFKDVLAQELRGLGIEFYISTVSTTSGRLIEVRVEDLDQLPDGFGATVPDDAYSVEVGGAPQPLGGS